MHANLQNFRAEIANTVCDIDTIKGISEKYAEGICYRFKCQIRQILESYTITRKKIWSISAITLSFRVNFSFDISRLMKKGKIVRLFAGNCFSFRLKRIGFARSNVI